MFYVNINVCTEEYESQIKVASAVLEAASRASQFMDSEYWL